MPMHRMTMLRTEPFDPIVAPPSARRRRSTLEREAVRPETLRRAPTASEIPRDERQPGPDDDAPRGGEPRRT